MCESVHDRSSQLFAFARGLGSLLILERLVAVDRNGGKSGQGVEHEAVYSAAHYQCAHGTGTGMQCSHGCLCAVIVVGGAMEIAFSGHVLLIRPPLAHSVLTFQMCIEQGDSFQGEYSLNQDYKLRSRGLVQIEQERAPA